MKRSRGLVPLIFGGLCALAILSWSIKAGADESSADNSSESPHGDSVDSDCLTCHTIDAWSPLAVELIFRHEDTGFRLDGGHSEPTCLECHGSLVFFQVGTACADCHEDAHSGELGFVCEICHAPAGWDDPRSFFDAHNRTLFPLFAPHAPLDCAACHRQTGDRWQYAGTPTECDDCHINDFRSALNPNHVTGGFSTLCTECHSATSPTWQSASFGGGNFVHPATFPLVGGHALSDCQACHADGFAGTSTNCDSCHLNDFNAATNPDHREAGFPLSCETCHSTTAWIPGAFNHDLTAFPLRGQHVSLECESCHADGYIGTPRNCVGCHRAEYLSTKDPDHVDAGFSDRCESCHDENSWLGAEFDHNQTRFPLRNAHAGLDCESCHADGFAGTSTECFSCHRSEFLNADDPDHVSAGFPTTCETCHNDRDWGNANFNHDTTGFALRDSHRGLDCASCHADGFAGTPRDCFGCHADDYDRANNPDHRAAGFPTTCETCHEATLWTESFWDHDALFPIYSGTHRGEWNDCADCHVSAATFTAFECIFCHEHNKNEMDDEHDDVRNYRYESQACFDCHPDGRE